MITEQQLKNVLEDLNKIVQENKHIDIFGNNKLNQWEKIFYDVIKQNIVDENYVFIEPLLEIIFDIFSRKKIVDRILVDFCESGNMQAFTFIVEHGADVTHGDNLPFITACKHGNLNLVLALVEIGIKPNAIPKALIEAALNCQTEIITELIKIELDINLNNSEALRLCANQGLTDMVDFLVQCGANVHALNDRALVVAVSRGHIDTVGILLYHGCNPDVWNGYCFKFAQRKNMKEILDLLNSKKVELEQQKIDYLNTNK